MAKRKKRVSRKRSLAAKKGWATRRKMAAVRARAKHAAAARKGWQKRREAVERLRRGAVRREPSRTPHIPTVARQDGLETAQDVAREWGVHPDEWAEEVSEDWDYEIHSLYQEYFYPAGGAGAF